MGKYCKIRHRRIKISKRVLADVLKSLTRMQSDCKTELFLM